MARADAVPGQATGPAEFVPGDILIKLRPEIGPGQRDRLRADLGAVRRRRFRSGAEHWRLGPGLTTEQAIARLRRHPRVQYVEPNYIVRTQRLPDDLRFPEQWGLFNYGQTGGFYGADIDAEHAWDVTVGSRAVLVGVIDSGIDYTHTDLAANIYTNPGEIPDNGLDDDQNGFVDDARGWDFKNNDNDPMDDRGHGTHVAGTIGAVGNNGAGVTGVAWEVTLVPLKFLGADGSGNTADAAEAVDYALRAGVGILNASWGGAGFSQTLLEAISEASDAGVLFVAAAGNKSADTDLEPHYPSSHDLPGIVAVAATDHNDSLAPFSNYGATTVDLAAPGGSILSTLPSGDYGRLSGTSMATPHVAGTAALLRALAPGIGVTALKAKLLDSVDAVPDLAGRMVSGGRLNAFRTLSGRETIAPGASDDLAASSPGSFSLTLTWTATGDDGDAGTASHYDVRYSTSPFDEAGFASAVRVRRPPAPLAAGSHQSLEVPGLASRTTYYFALKAVDDWGNAGPMSNLASGTTLDPPDVGVAPESLSAELFSGFATTRGLTIVNTGAGDLTFDVAVRAAPPVGGPAGSGGAGGWISPQPISGIVPPGGSADVAVRFDAAGLSGGDYDADLVVSTNDPDEPEVVVPARLHVTSAPDITLSSASLDFGSLFVGAFRSLSVTVGNDGTDVLTAGLATDHPDFTVEPANLGIPAGGSGGVVVTFHPSLATVLQGRLALETNDPDEGTLAIALTGTGLAAPDIAIAPAALDAGLFTGETAHRTVTLRNAGGNDLQFETAVRLAAPPTGGTGASVLLVQSVKPGGTTSNEQILSSNGLVYDKIEPARLAATDLSAYRLIIVPSHQTVSYYSTLAGQAHRLSAYVASGGVLEFHAAGSGSSGGEASLVTLPGGTRIHPFGSDLNHVLAGSHPLMAGLSFPFSGGSSASFSSLPANAVTIVRDVALQPTLVVYRFGGGTVIAGGQEFEVGHVIKSPTGIILRNMIPYAHGLGPRWLQVTPPSGLLPPGASLDLQISLDAAGLIGRDYRADLMITSNDPEESEIAIPFRLLVAGVPDLAVTPGTLDAPRLARRAATRTLTIENTGLFELIFEAVPAFGQRQSLARGRSLEDVLAELNAGFEAVTGAIPNRFDFSEGETGVAIGDGGDDMFDGGNLLHTDVGGPVAYSDNVIAGGSLFGPGGRYFTRKFPGLFVLAADVEGVSSFSIEGDLGADGVGLVDGTIMEWRLSGVDYRGLVKRVYNAFGPSVHHLIILADSSGALQELSPSTDNDHHQVYGLTTTRRLYYLLYSGRNGSYMDDTATLTIMRAFLEALRLAPTWVTITPASGTVPPGGRADLVVSFDPLGLFRGDYDADLIVFSNDPDGPQVEVPTRLHVGHPAGRRKRIPERPRPPRDLAERARPAGR